MQNCSNPWCFLTFENHVSTFPNNARTEKNVETKVIENRKIKIFTSLAFPRVVEGRSEGVQKKFNFENLVLTKIILSTICLIHV